jgi:5,6-dimethylbenzimidazole synthase
VLVESAECREAVRSSFVRANAKALECYEGEQRAQYVRLKLEGLQDAPVHLAVFADETTEAGSGLGRQTMPQTLQYSVVAAIQTLWLAARAEGLGLGWVSILEPKHLGRILEVPETWTLIAYLCIGRPVEEHLDPELERHHWQERIGADRLIFTR